MKCDCGNKLEDGQTMCEWCEYPETPIYRIKQYEAGLTSLFWVGQYSDGIEIWHGGNLNVYAPTKESGMLILEDYLNKKEQESGTF